MEIVVNGSKHKVVDVRIVYDSIPRSNNYYYFLYVKYEGDIFYGWVVIDVFRNSIAAIQRGGYLKDNINTDLVIER